MKVCRKSLVTILLWLMAACLLFGAVFSFPRNKGVVFAQTTVNYEFTESTDGDNFGTRGSAWAVQSGRFMQTPLGVLLI